MTYPGEAATEAQKRLEDEACAAVWDQLARSLEPDTELLELENWTAHQLDLISAIVTALNLTRKERLRQQQVVSLADWRKACGEEG